MKNMAEDAISIRKRGQTQSIFRFKLSQKLKITCKTAYPPLSNCRIPEELPCPTKEPDKVWLEILLAAERHGVREISVPKKGKNSIIIIITPAQ